MVIGDNNPRVFAETISLDAWRKPFDGKQGEADLHIDVVFGEKGRVGGVGSSVRFRLSLRRAEVHIIRDSEGVIDIDPRSVSRQTLPAVKESAMAKERTKLSGTLEGKASLTSVAIRGGVDVRKDITQTEKIMHSRNVAPMELTHWRTERGYAFKLGPLAGQNRLKGQPWPADERTMKINDSNFKRKHGEPPEVRVEIQCLREDLIIENIEFTSSKFSPWSRLGRKKKIAVEQYIRSELWKSSLPCEDLSEPFARLVLGDVIPSVRR